MAKTSLPPGFRFHPTDIELTVYYLKRKLLGKQLRCNAIADIDLYKFAPWELPEKASLQSRDLEWYFFCTRDKKYASGSRTNRSTEAGYWKATGKDRAITYNSRTVGMKRTLVFHLGRPPKGDRTDWVMYEYRLVDEEVSASGVNLDACVLCKIFQKSGPGPKIGAQYGAPFNEEDWNESNGELPSFAPSLPHCAPESSHGGLNSAGQHLAISDDGDFSPSSETNGKHNGNCVRPDTPFDSIHIQQLADIISCFSTNLLNTVGQDGSLADLSADYDNEAIFNEPDEDASQSVEKRLIQPTLELLQAEQYLELNDLSFSHADSPDPCSLMLSNDLSDRHPLDLEPTFKQKPPNDICSDANGTILRVADSGLTIENHVICSSTANGTTSTPAVSVPTIENHVICSSTANGTTSTTAVTVSSMDNHVH